MKRVYTDMAADLFHVGHVNLLKRAKEFGDYLIVGVHSDEDIKKYKRTPIVSEQDRYDVVKACRYVDEVIEDAPLIITEDFLRKNQIDLVVRGDDVSNELLKQQEVPIRLGIIKYLPRTENISTSLLIKKIKQENF